ncbi:MAG: glycosyltransferase [Pseudomonadota bacterium]
MNTERKKVPLISVGMPVYNGERYLAAAIESVLAQTEADFELIIADNASTDRTPEICEAFAARDSRVIVHRNPTNIGAAGNYALLVELARAPFFRWSNADDLFAPDLHALCLKGLQDHPAAVLSYGKTMLIDESGKELGAFDDNMHIVDDDPVRRLQTFFDRYRLTNAIYGLMRTDAVRKTHIFGDGALPAGDISFMAELVLLGDFVELPQQLFYRRMHPESSSHDRADEAKQKAFWAASQSSFRLPILRQTGRYLKYVWNTDDLRGSKLKASTYFMRRLMWQRSAVLRELVATVRAN